jgi:dTDP-4-dehydrorhamnose reductase
MSKNISAEKKIELWGGIECTINRVNDEYFDQLEYSGHYCRNNDIENIATLNITKLRYPVLWEKHQPLKDNVIDWSCTECNLNKLRMAGIVPVAGLVHHGSGPRYVNFFDSSFEEGLAGYASQVAEKFPWIEYYTLVNEPLTTARFCGLYGLWYPHEKNDYAFVRILVSECKGIVMAMQAIRKINPDAKLVQTDDLLKVHSVASLAYQADFENERRWLAYDLISGNITPAHPMWNYLLWAGIDESDLFYFLNNSCKPDIIGLNYYITSERFLDDNLENYPIHTHGKNNFHAYADVEAIRVNTSLFAGPYALIKEAWERYRLPIAVTEAHMHCHREEQMRWFYEIWKAAAQLKDEGANVLAVTAWALLGSFGWNKLLTVKSGDYEPGVFDVSSGKLRPTAMKNLLNSITEDNAATHTLLQADGWWKRDIRIHYYCDDSKQIPNCCFNRNDKPLLILGKTGTLGNGFARICEHRNIYHKLLGRDDVDITKPETVENIIKKFEPWAIINATGYVRVDDAEKDMHNCFLINSTGPANLARYCSKHNIQLLSFSSDLVFDGKKNSAYYESDEVNPVNTYGGSKAMAENKMQEYYSDALIIRTSAFFGPWDDYNFIKVSLENFEKGRQFPVAKDVVISPTYIPDLINISLDLLIDKEHGIWHVANDGEITWAELAAVAARKAGYSTDLINAQPLNEMGLLARRPHYSVLKSEKGFKMPSLENALERYFQEVLDAPRAKQLVPANKNNDLH